MGDYWGPWDTWGVTPGLPFNVCLNKINCLEINLGLQTWTRWWVDGGWVWLLQRDISYGHSPILSFLLISCYTFCKTLVNSSLKTSCTISIFGSSVSSLWLTCLLNAGLNKSQCCWGLQLQEFFHGQIASTLLASRDGVTSSSSDIKP